MTNPIGTEKQIKSGGFKNLIRVWVHLDRTTTTMTGLDAALAHFSCRLWSYRHPLIITHKSGMPLKAIPKGLCPAGQGCDPALSDNPSPLIQPKCLQCAT